VNCEHCGTETDPGHLLVSAIVNLSFWWPFSRKGTNGRLAEVLVSPGLPLTISRARQRARRCNQCGVIEIRYGVAD
jgi:hypothetical protein